ncbi:hypothetical protein MOQ_000682 [Trypanosoma cruzi marinkellei]|uniref:Protein NO VEIN C-terminal domain-containing protein n=1 Tax=Trypanosoma cruzi marinkellei TaxID=85056 RepID=K2NIB8_TRYCR|nr:hypothetical protein MOQ_000682 [Trypanosoma cruzi marinkellei]
MQKSTLFSMEAIDAYVKELQSGHDRTSTAPPLTVENILCRIYARFYSKEGQPPLPNGLPFSLKQVPSLASIAVLQSRITAMIQSAVATRPVVTLYELEAEVCLTENVEMYAELGLGCSLAALPCVRHLFGVGVGTNIAPVTSTEFMHFLLFDTNAQALLSGGGDAGDAVRAFACCYKGGRYTSMQLGIHIQHFPWLLRFVRQEVGRTSTFFSDLLNENAWCYERNKVIYERVVQSLHTAMMSHKNHAEEPPCEVKFVVHASQEEAMGTDFPPEMWGTCNGSDGGLSLHGILSAEPSFLLVDKRHEAHTLEAAKVEYMPPMPVSSFSSSASPHAAAATETVTDATKTTPRMVTSAHARKRRRGVVVVDERTEVFEETLMHPLKQQKEEMQSGDAYTSTTEAVAAGSTLLPTLLEPPPIPLEKVPSILRCLAVMQSSTVAGVFVAPCGDFAVFRTYASKLLSRLRRVERDAKEHVGLVSISNDPFSVDADTLLRFFSSNEISDVWCAFHTSLISQANGLDCGKGMNTSSPGELLLHCLELGFADLMFLPLVATKSLLPLMAARSLLFQRVLLSGRHTSTDLLVFHPLQFVFDASAEGVDGHPLVAVLDGEILLRGLQDSESHRTLNILLAKLEGHGVLTSVPESWLYDGFLLQVVRSQMRDYFNGAERTDVEACHMALRMLLLYWWLVGMWRRAPPSSRIANGVAEILHNLQDVVWLPSLSRHGSESDAAVRVESWHAPSELFPFIGDFKRHGLQDFLHFAPHEMRDVISLSRQNGDTSLFQHAHGFLDKWIAVVQSGMEYDNTYLLPSPMGMPEALTAAVALRLLCLLRVGKRISVFTIRYLLRRIAETDEEEVLIDAKRLPIIPLSMTHTGPDENGEIVVREMATCETVCWESLPDVDRAHILDRSINFIGEDFYEIAVDVLRVSPVPSLATWLAAAGACRKRIMAGPEVNASLTELFLRVFSHSCTAHYRHLLSQFEQQHPESPGSVAEAALKGVVDVVSGDSLAGRMFPLHGRWRSPAEGLFYCGPYYRGFSGLTLKVTTLYGAAVDKNDDNDDTVDGDMTPSLPVLIFTEQPHHAVAAVLRRMGVVALESCTEKIVTFGRMNAVNSAGLHKKIAECTPRVQEFLRRHYPHYYALVNSQVLHSLEYFSTVLAAEPVVREVLRFQGKMYVMTRTVRCWYVRQHNCLYGADEEFFSFLAADAIADLFLPLMDEEVRQGVKNVLQECLRDAELCFNDTQITPCPPKKTELPPPPKSSAVLEEVWQISAAPALRSRDHFPFGKDGFGLRGKEGGAPKTSGTLGGLKMPQMKLLLWGEGGYMARSLPQWKCDVFDSAHDVLRAMERGRSNAGSDSEDEGCPSTPTPIKTKEKSSTRKRARRGGRSRFVAPAMVVQEHRETADYALEAERFVAAKLRAEVPPDVDVVWVNENGEYGTPYDILLVRRNVRDVPSSTSTEILAYVEVKSTCTNVRRDFEMSLREFLFAARFGQAYKIYRVFRASTSATHHMHVEVLEDVVKLWRTGSLTMTGGVKVMLAPGA